MAPSASKSSSPCSSRGVRIAVDEVVVQRHRERPQSSRQQLHRQPLRERRLARRRGARDEDDTKPVAAADDVGRNRRDPRFVKRLGDQRHFGQPAVPDRVVERARAADSKLVEPLTRFGEGREEPRVRLEGRDLAGAGLVRILQDEPGRVRKQPEALEAARRGHHVALQVVAAPAQLVEDDALLAAVCEQPRLVELAARLEQRHRLLARARHLRDALVGRDDRAHAVFDARELVRGEGRAAADAAVVRAQRRRRVLDVDAGVWKDLGRGGDQQEGERPAVDAHPVRIGERDGTHVDVHRDRRRELAQTAVDQSPDRFSRAGRRACGAQDLTNGSARRRLEMPAVRQRDQDGAARLRGTNVAHRGILMDFGRGWRG